MAFYNQRPVRESGGKVVVREHQRKAPKKRKPYHPTTKTVWGPGYGPGRSPGPNPLDAIFGPQESYLNQSISREQQQAQSEAGRERAKAEAYAKWYGTAMPQQIQGIYSTAANEQSHFAQGFSHGMQIAQQQQAGQTNATLAAAGAPEGQMQHPNSDMADVIFGTGGFIPATTLSTQGAAFGAAAALMPGAILAEGGKNASKILAESADRVFKLRGELADLLAKKNAAGLSMREERRAAQVKAKLDKAEAKADAQKPHRISTTLSAAYRILIDDYGNVIKDKNGKPIPYEPYVKPSASSRGGGSSSSGGSSGGSTASKAKGGRYLGYVNGQPIWVYRDGHTEPYTGAGANAGGTVQKKFTASQITDARESAVDAWNGIRNADDPSQWDLAPLSYGAAYAEMVRHGIPPLLAQQELNKFWKRRGYTVTVANRMKGKYNVWEKAQSGRPLKDFVNPKAAAARSGRQNTAYDPRVPEPVQNAISAAMKQLGQKYVWGAESRGEGGFDCSGLIDWAFRQAGIDFPGRLTTWSAAKMGVPVSANDLKPGDFIISNRGKHMTLYIGNGNVIAASSTRGKVVIMPVGDLGPIVGARRLSFGSQV